MDSHGAPFMWFAVQHILGKRVEISPLSPGPHTGSAPKSETRGGARQDFPRCPCGDCLPAFRYVFFLNLTSDAIQRNNAASFEN